VQIGQQNVQFRKDSFLSTDILPEEEIAHDHSINFPIDDEKPSPTKFAGPFSGLSVSGLITGIFLGLGTLFIGLACMISALHRIDEGHVGVYYKFGALMEVKSPPGVHWMQPFVTQVASIRLTPETRTMDPMVCTTRDGVRNVFRDVQVITSIEEDQVLVLVRQFTTDLKTILVYDRVREAIQYFCANNTIDEVSLPKNHITYLHN